jgi:predicted hydrocarbon binding protein
VFKNRRGGTINDKKIYQWRVISNVVEERKLSPYHMGRIIVDKRSNPFFFNITLLPEAYRAIGVLQEIIRPFPEENVPVLLCKLSIPHGEPSENIRVIVSADIRDPKQAERIASKLRRVRYVKEVDYSPPIIPGVGIDMWSFPPMIRGERAAIFSESIFKWLFRFGWEKIGSGYGGILYRSFFEAGREAYEKFYSKVATSKDEHVKLLEETMRLLGYGILKVVELTDKIAIFRIYDNLECRSLMGVEGAENAMLRGLLAGWLSGYWGVDIYFIRPKETRCIIRGDPYCELEYRKEKYEPLV